MRVCPTNREIQRLLQRVEEEHQQTIQSEEPVELPPPPSTPPPPEEEREELPLPVQIPPPEPRLDDMEPVQYLFEDEEYLEQELENVSIGLSSLPIIQSPPLSPAHHHHPHHNLHHLQHHHHHHHHLPQFQSDPAYLSGGQAFDFHQSHSSMSSPTRQSYQSASPPLSPTHQNSHYRAGAGSPPLHISPDQQQQQQQHAYSHFSPPSGPMDPYPSPPSSPLRRSGGSAPYRASPPLPESVCMYRSQSGSPGRYQQQPESLPISHPARPKSPLSKMASQRSFQLQSQASQCGQTSSQHHRLQPSMAQIVRTNQGNGGYGGGGGGGGGQLSAHPLSSRYQGSSMDERSLVDRGLVEPRLVYQPSLDGRAMPPSPQVQSSLSAGALCQHGGRGVPGSVLEGAMMKDELGPPSQQQRPASAYRPGGGGGGGSGGGGGLGGGLRFSQTPQISRSQSAAYYPVSERDRERVVAASGGGVCQMGSPEIPAHLGLRRPVSASPNELPLKPQHQQSSASPRPLIHSQSVSMRFSPSSSNLSSGPACNLGPGFRPASSISQMEIPLQAAYDRDDLGAISPSQGGGGGVGGLYGGDGARSRSTPFMGIIDKTARTHQYLHQPSVSRGGVGGWAMSSMDSGLGGSSGGITSPTSPGNLMHQASVSASTSSYSPPASLGNIAYYNKTNNAQNGHLLEDDYYSGGSSQSQPSSLGKLANGSARERERDLLERVSQGPTYQDVKVARTLPVAQVAYQENMFRQLSRDGRLGQPPTSPIKPKRPYVESNV